MCRYLAVCVAAFLLATSATAEELVKPAEYLAALQPPKFAERHTLPPLTRYGWTLSYDARVELADQLQHQMTRAAEARQAEALTVGQACQPERAVPNGTSA